MKNFTMLLVATFVITISLCQAQTPAFYGMTINGGSIGEGTIIEFNPNNNSESVVWNFGIDSDGANPYGDLVYFPSNGLFYGMTYGGGRDTAGNGIIHAGTIFTFNPTNNSESVVKNFQAYDGALPYGDLVYDSSYGLFYGILSAGGSYGDGNIISFNPSNNSESLVCFLDTAYHLDNPEGNLVYDPSNGLYYGMTERGWKL